MKKDGLAARSFIVDVFAEAAGGGNRLAVVVPGAHGLADADMQRIAASMDYSETTFVPAAGRADGSWPVRIFTPAREIAFAGHPILGTAWAIRRWLAPQLALPIRLQLAAAAVPVGFEADAGGAELAWFAAPPIALGRTCDAGRIAAAVGLAAQDLDPALPVREASAGTSALIVPLRDLAALRRSRLDLAAFAPLAADGFPPLVYLFCRETRDPRDDLSARFFFEANGVREDAATGNGAAFLGAWLQAHAPSPAARRALRIEQGHELGRPSIVHLRARAGAIEVGGQVRECRLPPAAT